MEHIIHTNKDFNKYHSREYLAEHIDKKSLSEFFDSCLKLAEENPTNNTFDFLVLAGAIFNFLNNDNEHCNYWFYNYILDNLEHIDTQERDKSWRIQLHIWNHKISGAANFLRGLSATNTISGYRTYLGEPLKSDYFSVNGDTTILTCWLGKI